MANKVVLVTPQSDLPNNLFQEFIQLEAALTTKTDKPTSLVDEVYEAIWDKIITGKLKPSHKLNIVTLACALKVSRTPVRGTLGYLVKDGNITQTSHSSFSIATFSHYDIIEIYDLCPALQELTLKLVTYQLSQTYREPIAATSEYIEMEFKIGKVIPPAISNLLGEMGYLGPESRQLFWRGPPRSWIIPL